MSGKGFRLGDLLKAAAADNLFLLAVKMNSSLM